MHRLVGIEQRLDRLRDGLQAKFLVVFLSAPSGAAAAEEEQGEHLETQAALVRLGEGPLRGAPGLLQVQVHAHGARAVPEVGVDLNVRNGLDRKSRLWALVEVQDLAHKELHGPPARGQVPHILASVGLVRGATLVLLGSQVQVHLGVPGVRALLPLELVELPRHLALLGFSPGAHLGEFADDGPAIQGRGVVVVEAHHCHRLAVYLQVRLEACCPLDAHLLLALGHHLRARPEVLLLASARLVAPEPRGIRRRRSAGVVRHDVLSQRLLEQRPEALRVDAQVALQFLLQFLVPPTAIARLQPLVEEGASALAGLLETEPLAIVALAALALAPPASRLRALWTALLPLGAVLRPRPISGARALLVRPGALAGPGPRPRGCW
mmetsp:Transcript_55674/g.154091  ORF Transcript_55674/g.154091 Transcript_55674/m.154091 type:complete len:381 (-) Transcript_55674:87-1229(-)